jgi:hypothetical protein
MTRRADKIRFAGSFEQLRRIVERTGISGDWEYMPADYLRYLCHDSAILNWWESTGTVSFQGPEIPRERLKNAIAGAAHGCTIEGCSMPLLPRPGRST